MFGHAVQAVAVIDELAEELPEGRGYIRDPLRRAANSIALNVAEGAGERGGQFTQAYNGHIAVDDEWHVIVGQGASNQAPDTESFLPILERVQATVGQLPEKATADAGFWSPENARWAEEPGVD